MIPKYITDELNEGKSIEETLNKYNTNLKELFKSVVGETKKKKKKKKRKGRAAPKYYSYNKRAKNWSVARRVNGKQTFFGCYPTEKEAALAVALLDEYGWTKENNWKVRSMVREIINGDKKV